MRSPRSSLRERRYVRKGRTPAYAAGVRPSLRGTPSRPSVEQLALQRHGLLERDGVRGALAGLDDEPDGVPGRDVRVPDLLGAVRLALRVGEARGILERRVAREIVVPFGHGG